MNVLQNQFSPEFGGASGGVFNAIVTTWNQLRARVHLRILSESRSQCVGRNRCNGWIEVASPGSTRIGWAQQSAAPIIKNKLFYFGNYEYVPTGQASVPGQAVYAPTAAVCRS